METVMRLFVRPSIPDAGDTGNAMARERLQRTLAVISEVKDLCGAPAISFGVMHGGEVIFAENLGLADVDKGQKADSETAYLLGSCSKLFTSTAVGTLVGHGLEWTDRISKHVPDFNPLADPKIGKQATIIDACRHSTGLANPNAVFLGPGYVPIIEGDKHVAMINALPTSNEFGPRFNHWWYYSNAAFGLLSYVIKSVSGSDSFATYVQERICEPLKLRQTLLSEKDVRDNKNVAHPYVRMRDGTYQKIMNESTSEAHGAVLASMAIRSSVNDLLTFLNAVMQCYAAEQEADRIKKDEQSAEKPHHEGQKDSEPTQKYLHLQTSTSTSWLSTLKWLYGQGSDVPKDNPLRNISTMWNWWWGRPIDDGFENNTAYTLGWLRTTMPTSALGMLSHNAIQRTEDIIGRDSPRRTVYGHSGCTNGSVATMYIIPESRSAVVVLANTADAGDASDTVSKILLQALFDLKPDIDLLPALRLSVQDRLDKHDSMIKDWEAHRDVSKYSASSDELRGTYFGLGASFIRLLPSDKSKSGLRVVFGGQDSTSCELEPYNHDALSFMPLDHKDKLVKGWLDMDYWTVGIFRFVRDEGTGEVVGFRWQWDQWDYAGLWAKIGEDLSEEEIQTKSEKITAQYGKFTEKAAEKEWFT